MNYEEIYKKKLNDKKVDIFSRESEIEEDEFHETELPWIEAQNINFSDNRNQLKR